MPFVQSINIENFKSYRGVFTIGPLKSFNAVIGPNGCGHSNFVDAIRFVLGGEMSSLRVEKLCDLIHDGSFRALFASVSATFRLDNGAVQKFTRSISRGCDLVEHQINGNRVDSRQYLDALEELNINIEVKSDFLGFEGGTVESQALMMPRKLTKIFDIVSGSADLEGEYVNLQKKILEAKGDLNFLERIKKLLRDEEKLMNKKQEMEMDQSLRSELKVKVLEFYLFGLFYNEKEIRMLNRKLTDQEKIVGELKAEKEKADEELRDHGRNLENARKDLDEIDEEIRALETKIEEGKSSLTESRELVVLTEMKLNSANESLRKAHQVDEVHKVKMEDLERKLDELNIQMKVYEEVVAEECQNQERNIQLDYNQVEQYHILKAEAQKQSALYLQGLISLIRDQKADLDRLYEEKCKRGSIQFSIECKECKNKEAQLRHDKLMEYISTTENSLRSLDNSFKKTKAEVDGSKNRVNSLELNLNEVMEKIHDAKFDKHDISRRKEEEDVITDLKETFSGVYDRLINMCEVINDRYDIAVTKIVGKYSNAIVVNNETTARKCIQYLKKNNLSAETFLPIDGIRIEEPLEQDVIRRICQLRQDVRLLHDVLKFDPTISRIVQFITKNTFICRNSIDAEYLATKVDLEGYPPNVVSLDGALYQKSGLIAGGSFELNCRAKYSQLNELKFEREIIEKEIYEAMKQCRLESDLEMIESQRKAVALRLKEAESDKRCIVEKIYKRGAKIKSYSDELKKCNLRIEQVESEIAEHSWDTKIKEAKELMNNIEDEIFAEFCDRVGISNIRQYEQSELRIHPDRARKRLEFENENILLTNELELTLITRDEEMTGTRAIVQRWENIMRKTENELGLVRRDEVKRKEDIEVIVVAMTQPESERLTKMSEVSVMEETMNKIRASLKTMANKKRKLQRLLATAKYNLEIKKLERYDALKTSRIENVAIPLMQGDFGDDTAQIIIDYSLLPVPLKQLDNSDEIRKTDATLAKGINDILLKVEYFQAPICHVLQELEETQIMIQAVFDEIDREKEATQALEKIKEKRHDKFMSCLEQVSKEVNNVYKALMQDQSVGAYFILENKEEPYLDGLDFHCILPGECSRIISDLSREEETVASLALSFAIHSYQQSPVLVLDEVDGALDSTSVRKVAAYIQQKKDQIQTINLSSKTEFFGRADYLIGITAVGKKTFVESEVYYLDLTQYRA